MSKKLEFWFEYGSTYSYLSAMRIETVAENYGVRVIWRPFLLGVLFKKDLGYTDSPFNRHAKKGQYMWRDMERLVENRDLPELAVPSPFPQNSLLPARISCALLDDERLPAFVRAVYRAEFQHGEQISDPFVMFDILSQNGFDAPSVMEKAGKKKSKEQLKELTSWADKKGLFGAPAFTTVDGELFWGDDRMEAAMKWVIDHA